MTTGWQCPVCLQGVRPDLAKCPCVSPEAPLAGPAAKPREICCNRFAGDMGCDCPAPKPPLGPKPDNDKAWPVDWTRKYKVTYGCGCIGHATGEAGGLCPRHKVGYRSREAVSCSICWDPDCPTPGGKH